MFVGVQWRAQEALTPCDPTHPSQKMVVIVKLRPLNSVSSLPGAGIRGAAGVPHLLRPGDRRGQPGRHAAARPLTPSLQVQTSQPSQHPVLWIQIHRILIRIHGHVIKRILFLQL